MERGDGKVSCRGVRFFSLVNEGKEGGVYRCCGALPGLSQAPRRAKCVFAESSLLLRMVLTGLAGPFTRCTPLNSTSNLQSRLHPFPCAFLRTPPTSSPRYLANSSFKVPPRPSPSPRAPHLPPPPPLPHPTLQQQHDLRPTPLDPRPRALSTRSLALARWDAKEGGWTR